MPERERERETEREREGGRRQERVSERMRKKERKKGRKKEGGMGGWGIHLSTELRNRCCEEPLRKESVAVTAALTARLRRLARVLKVIMVSNLKNVLIWKKKKAPDSNK